MATAWSNSLADKECPVKLGINVTMEHIIKHVSLVSVLVPMCNVSQNW